MQSYSRNTIAVELTVRHTGSDGETKIVTRQLASRAGTDSRPQWSNPRIAAAIHAAVDNVLADFGISETESTAGKAGQFTDSKGAPVDAVRWS